MSKVLPLFSSVGGALLFASVGKNVVVSFIDVGFDLSMYVLSMFCGLIMFEYGIAD